MSKLFPWGDVKGGESFENVLKYIVLGGATVGAFWLYDKVAQWTGEDPTRTAKVLEENLGGVFDFIGNAATVGITGAGLGLAAWYGWKVARLLKQNEQFQAIRIKPHEKQQIDMEKVKKMVEGFGQWGRNWFEELLKGRMWFRWQVVKDENGKILFYFLCPKDVAPTARDYLKLGFPKCSAEVDKNYTGLPDFYTNEGGNVGHMALVTPEREALGLKNKLENVIGDIAYIMPEESLLEVRFTPTEIKELRDMGRSQIEKLKDKPEKLAEEQKKIQRITERYLGRTAFEVSILLWSKQAIKRLANSITQHTKGLNALTLKQYKLFPQLRNPYKYPFIDPILPHRKMTLNDIELTNLLHLPPPNHPVREHIEIALDKLQPKPYELNQGHKLGIADHDDLIVRDAEGNIDWEKSRAIRVTTEVFTVHPVISGKSGSGKGAVIISIMDEFLEKWVQYPDTHPGFTLNDPHGSTIDLILNRLLELERRGYQVPWDRVKCYHVGSETHPMPLNLLYKDADVNIDAMVEETVEIILRAFSSDLSTSRMILENGLYALLYDKKPRTIAELPRLFQKVRDGRGKNAPLIPNPLLMEVLPHIKNPVVREWFETEIINKDKERDITPLITRLSPFLNRKNMQRMYMQTENAFADTKRIFDEGHIVLISYQGLPDGHPAYKLTAGWIANRYHQEMKKRNMDSKNRVHLLIFDEAQMFHVPRFIDIVAQDRKFGFGLVTMTQDIHKLAPELKSALTINSGLMISLNQSDGAKVMSELMRNRFTPEHLSNLPKMHCAVWSDEGSANMLVPPPAFIYEGQRVPWKDKNGNTAEEHRKAAKAARDKFIELVQRDSRPAHIVDQEIEAMMTGERRLKAAGQ